MAFGLCERCYNKQYGEKNRQILREKEKRRRLTQPDDVSRRVAERMKRWADTHREQIRQYANKRNARLSRWKIGMTVWYHYAGFWCEGTLVGAYGHAGKIVRLKGGTEIRTIARCLRTENPEV
jgi:hypothetical protein